MYSLHVDIKEGKGFPPGISNDSLVCNLSWGKDVLETTPASGSARKPSWNWTGNFQPTEEPSSPLRLEFISKVEGNDPLLVGTAVVTEEKMGLSKPNRPKVENWYKVSVEKDIPGRGPFTFVHVVTKLHTTATTYSSVDEPTGTSKSISTDTLKEMLSGKSQAEVDVELLEIAKALQGTKVTKTSKRHTISITPKSAPAVPTLSKDVDDIIDAVHGKSQAEVEAELLRISKTIKQTNSAQTVDLRSSSEHSSRAASMSTDALEGDTTDAAAVVDVAKDFELVGRMFDDMRSIQKHMQRYDALHRELNELGKTIGQTLERTGKSLSVAGVDVGEGYSEYAKQLCTLHEELSHGCRFTFAEFLGEQEQLHKEHTSIYNTLLEEDGSKGEKEESALPADSIPPPKDSFMPHLQMVAAHQYLSGWSNMFASLVASYREACNKCERVDVMYTSDFLEISRPTDPPGWGSMLSEARERANSMDGSNSSLTTLKGSKARSGKEKRKRINSTTSNTSDTSIADFSEHEDDFANGGVDEQWHEAPKKVEDLECVGPVCIQVHVLKAVGIPQSVLEEVGSSKRKYVSLRVKEKKSIRLRGVTLPCNTDDLVWNQAFRFNLTGKKQTLSMVMETTNYTLPCGVATVKLPTAKKWDRFAERNAAITQRGVKVPFDGGDAESDALTPLAGSAKTTPSIWIKITRHEEEIQTRALHHPRQPGRVVTRKRSVDDSDVVYSGSRGRIKAHSSMMKKGSSVRLKRNTKDKAHGRDSKSVVRKAPTRERAISVERRNHHMTLPKRDAPTITINTGSMDSLKTLHLPPPILTDRSNNKNESDPSSQ